MNDAAVAESYIVSNNGELVWTSMDDDIVLDTASISNAYLSIVSLYDRTRSHVALLADCYFSDHGC